MAFTHSDRKTVKVGVLQGSPLDPLLFNIYINDLNLQDTNTSLQIYADDTTEYASGISPPVPEFIINFHLHILSTWLRQNYLEINASKTQAMAIGQAPCSYYFTGSAEQFLKCGGRTGLFNCGKERILRWFLKEQS